MDPGVGTEKFTDGKLNQLKHLYLDGDGKRDGSEYKKLFSIYVGICNMKDK